jgi:HEAT repeat protein
LLATYGDRSALPALIALLSERNRDFLSRTLHAVVDALGRIRDPAALEPLFALLADSSDDEVIANYRYMILRAILQIGGEAVLSRVEPWLVDPEVRNVHVALDELARLDSPKVDPILLAILAKGDRTAKASALRALVERDCAACAPLAAKALSEENDPWLLSEALKAITWFGQSGSEPRILALLALDPADTRNAALFYALLRATMVFRPAGAGPRVAEIARLSAGSRSLAIEALRELRDPATLPALRAFLAEEVAPAATFRLTVALAHLGEKAPAEKLLADLAGSESPSDLLARVELLFALGRTGDLGPLLDRAAQADPENSLHLYRLAGLCAQIGEVDRALDLMTRALARRPFMRNQVRDDPDFALLRAHEPFRLLLRKSR